ncbi:MAG: radical SAM protein [Candidatus Omnitrophica bacterium]|nr:radical SAM protein [Candidatus Omnitrophota bacterium]
MAQEKQDFKYIYGPVSSWRLGRSLGVDPIAQKHKVCCFDCVYCQVGREKPVIAKRRVFIDADNIIAEIKTLPEVIIDCITLSGTGEPTLAANLGRLIRAIKKIRPEPVAVITNSVLLGQKTVRDQLLEADIIMAKLDASTNDVLISVNNPYKNITALKIITGLKKLRKVYKGTLALQIMFVKENQHIAEEIALLAKKIKADKIYINTPLRASECKPLSKAQILQIKKVFLSHGLQAQSVYDVKKENVLAINTAQTRRVRRLYNSKKKRVFKRR